MAQIPEDAKSVLDQPNLAHLATINPDGSPQVTPVWIDHEGDTVLFNTAKGRQKPRNLARDPRVSISIQNAENPYQPLIIQGRVQEITEDGADDHINALAKKYLDEEVYPFRQPGEERLKVIIHPEKVSFGM
jgi:PPOX class probable F420-dependent enzyme